MQTWVAICFGKDCQKRKKDIDRLRADLKDHVEIRISRCLKVCKKAPVIVIDRGEGEICLHKIRGKDIREELIEYLKGAQPSSQILARHRKQKKKNVYKKSSIWKDKSN